MAKLGRIIPKRVYETTDGRRFDDKKSAINHQEKLNRRKNRYE